MEKKNKEPKNAFVVPRRAVWFVLRTLIIIMVIVTLTFSVFLTAMYASSVYIIVTEGVRLRAMCVLGQAETTELEQYFTPGCIENDSIFADNVYEYYNIESVDYRLTVDKISVLPWNTTATIKLTERIPSITGSAYEDAPSAAIPEWESVRYTVICMRENNRWYITKITVDGKALSEKPNATPDMSKTPITLPPTATPTIKPPTVSSETTENTPTPTPNKGD